MNTEYLWWLLALLLAGGGMVAFLALGRIPETDDEPAADPAGQGVEAHPSAAADTADGSPQRAPFSTTVPGSEDPSATSDTP